MSYYFQELELEMTEKIVNYDGTEKYFNELEDDLRSWKYVYGSLESARAFLEIARKNGNEKYIESCHQRDKKILTVLEKVCLENMDDLNAIQNYLFEHKKDYAIDLPYYLYLASANVGNKAYVKKYIQDRAEHIAAFYSYECIQCFLSDCEHNWEGNLEEYICTLLNNEEENSSFYEYVQAALDKKLQYFKRNKAEFLKIQKFAAYNKDAYYKNRYNKEKLTLEEDLLKIAKKLKKMTFLKLHDETKQGFIKELEAMLSDCNTKIDQVKEFVEQNNRCFSFDLEEIAFRIAIRLGNKNYVKAAAPSFKLHVNRRYLQYIDETDDADMRAFVSEYGLWVKDHLSECDFVIQFYNKYDQKIILCDKKFLKEAYSECKDKGLNRLYFLDLLNIEVGTNGRAKLNDFNREFPADVYGVIAGLDYANQTLYFEGHYTWGPFFEWHWEQDIHSDANDKCGYLYILKKPNRHGDK